MYQPMKVSDLNGPDGDVVLAAIPGMSEFFEWPKGMIHVRKAFISRDKYNEGGGSNKRGIVWVDFATGDCRAEPPVSSVLEFMGVDTESAEVAHKAPKEEIVEPDDNEEGMGEQTVIKSVAAVQVPRHGEVWEVEGRSIYFTRMDGVRGHAPCMVGVFNGLSGRKPSRVWSMEEWEKYIKQFGTLKAKRKRSFKGKNVKEVNMRVFGPREGETWIRRVDREEIRIDKVIHDRFKYGESEVFYTNLATSKSSLKPARLQYIWYRHVCSH